MTHVQRTANRGRRRVDRENIFAFCGAIKVIDTVLLPLFYESSLNAVDCGLLGYAWHDEITVLASVGRRDLCLGAVNADMPINPNAYP